MRGAPMMLVAPRVRDPYRLPGGITNPFNTPIGTGASYVYIPWRLPDVGNTDDWTSLAPDVDQIILAPTAPQVPVYRAGPGPGATGWTPVNTATVSTWPNTPIPADYRSDRSGTNGCAAILGADGVTIRQHVAFAVDSSGNAGCLGGADFGTQNILTDTTGQGSHGGSQLGSICGSLRVGELCPGGNGPPHALKITFDLSANGAKPTNYGGASGGRRAYSPTPDGTTTFANGSYRWPAIVSDGGTFTGGASAYGAYSDPSMPAGMVIGALLAIPPGVTAFELGLETEPAKQLLWTLQRYGMYVVDHSNHSNVVLPTNGGGKYGLGGYCLNTEDGAHGSFLAQFNADWGLNWRDAGSGNPTRARENTSWTRDVLRLLRACRLVENNTSANRGGGGTPLVPPHVNATLYGH